MFLKKVNNKIKNLKKNIFEGERGGIGRRTRFRI